MAEFERRNSVIVERRMFGAHAQPEGFFNEQGFGGVFKNQNPLHFPQFFGFTPCQKRAQVELSVQSLAESGIQGHVDGAAATRAVKGVAGHDEADERSCVQQTDREGDDGGAEPSVEDHWTRCSGPPSPPST